MTWPEVFQWLALIAGALAALLGALWTLGRMARPWIADVARTEADRVGGKVDALASNDFPHLEKRLAEVRADFGARFDGIGARFDGIEARLERMDRRAAAMESRILAAVAKTPEAPEDHRKP